MPRKNAGHTGKPSRNPDGRPKGLPRRAALFTLTKATKDLVKAQAVAAGYGTARQPNASAFVEDLIVLHGPDLVRARKAARDAAVAEADGGEGGGVGGPGDQAAGLPGVGARMGTEI